MAGTQAIGSAALTELARDLCWSWHRHSRALDAARTGPVGVDAQPWAVLQTVSPRGIEELLARPEVRRRVAELIAQRRGYLAAPAWFQQPHGGAAFTRVAYFSVEFALREALPIYSGGPGNVAGDQQTAASDLGVPVVESAQGRPRADPAPRRASPFPPPRGRAMILPAWPPRWLAHAVIRSGSPGRTRRRWRTRHLVLVAKSRVALGGSPVRWRPETCCGRFPASRLRGRRLAPPDADGLAPSCGLRPPW